VLSLLSLEGPLHPHLDSSSSSFLVKPWLALCTTSAGECRRRGCCCCLLLGRDVTFGCFLFFWYSFSREKCRTLTVTCSARSALILIRRPARFLNTTMYGLRSSRNRFFSACFSSSLTNPCCLFFFSIQIRDHTTVCVRFKSSSPPPLFTFQEPPSKEKTNSSDDKQWVLRTTERCRAFSALVCLLHCGITVRLVSWLGFRELPHQQAC
jgi:hypothetical protein